MSRVTIYLVAFVIYAIQTAQKNLTIHSSLGNIIHYTTYEYTKGDDSMAKKRNIIVGQSGGPTSVINSSLAGVYKNAIERGFDKVYGMLHGIQGLLDEQYIDLSTQIHSELDIELLKRTPSAFLGSCRFKLPEIHEDKAIYEKIFEILNRPSIMTLR